MITLQHNQTRKRLPRPYRAGRHMLTVRALIAATDWLRGPLRWEHGRVVWLDQRRGHVAPTKADLALVRARLARIARYRGPASLLLGDCEVWLADQSSAVRLAEALCGLGVVDLTALAQRARAGETESIRQLVTLLAAEALCINRLPLSPAVTLLACGEQASVMLSTLHDDTAAPLAARALAALLLGTLDQRRGCRRMGQAFTDGWLYRAYSWGQQAGLPDDPGLIVTLLREPDGIALVRRVQRTRRKPPSFQLPSKLLRQLLAAGVPADQVVALDEAAISVDRNVDLTLLHCSGQIIRAFRVYVRATQDPKVVMLIANLIKSRLELGRLVDLTQIETAVVEQGLRRPIPARNGHAYGRLSRRAWLTAQGMAIKVMLQAGLELPSPLYKPYLELLTEQHEQLWSTLSVSVENYADDLQVSIHREWVEHGAPLLELLRMTNDPVLVREAFVLNVHRELVQYNWTKQPLRPWILAAIRSLGEDETRWQLHVLFRAIHSFTSAEAAHAVIRPFTDALTAAPAELRAHLLHQLLDKLHDEEVSVRETLPRLTPYTPQLIRLARQQPSSSLPAALVPGLLALDTIAPAEAAAWLNWLIAYVCSAQPEEGWNESGIELGLLLAVTLADGEFVRFQLFVRTAAQHPIEESWRRREHIRRGIAALQRLRGLRAPLIILFPQQPKRCIALLLRVGLATRLGDEALAPLKQLDAAHEVGQPWFELPDQQRHDLLGCETAGWDALLTFAPELRHTAGAYLYAQWLRGGSAEIPAGVRHALTKPLKLAAELEHIERLLVEKPERVDLVRRAANLRARLNDPTQTSADVRAEVATRLVQITAEAQLAAAEQQLRASFRARLAMVAGPLPPGLVLDDDLLNATLLTVDIINNRRLLRRLLIAHIAGEHSWREQLPSNAAFLAQLQARGVNVSAWLAAYPRRYRCRTITGSIVHLHLERTPIRILQMGNYFDTCLSFGGINSFSTVANACELNKRVIYATDAAGRVVGRKLVAINAEGGLVGFYTYTALSDEAASDALRDIFNRYVAAFAARCGLQLEDSGEVPRLFAEEWYDDGIQEWEAATPRTAVASGPAA